MTEGPAQWLSPSLPASGPTPSPGEPVVTGTLHLHMLLWLKETPPADEMQCLLKSESFCDQIQTFITRNIHAHVPGMTSETLKAIK